MCVVVVTSTKALSKTPQLKEFRALRNYSDFKQRLQGIGFFFFQPPITGQRPVIFTHDHLVQQTDRCNPAALQNLPSMSRKNDIEIELWHVSEPIDLNKEPEEPWWLYKPNV